MQHESFMIASELTNLALVKSKVNPSLFCKVNNGEVIGAIITHVDDFINCGSSLFDSIVIKHLLERFIPGSKKLTSLSFVTLAFSLIRTARKSH